ncbi:acyltransferase [uncultured Hoeflea sp.]|uniref:acyltransferase family protein n=1 Tax=uncultured Hoeflea sp. TaxID=538666 RepID=UPI0026378B03|nr:acyltransferase [uncultured Hoeflea sp.]
MIASVQTGGKNEALESMRGLCALFIVLLHDSANNFLSDNAFINNSHVAVDFFFVLSGYVIALSYAERIGDWRQMGGFMRRRLLRIYPLHLFVLLAFLGVECSKYLAEIHFGVVANTPAFSASNLENFLINLALLQGVLPDPVAFNPPSWSISVEFMTYAAFALAVLTRRTGALILAALLASLLFILRYHDGHLNDGDSYQLIRCIWSFAIGYFVYRFQSLSVRFGSVSQAALFAICGLAVIYAAGTDLEVMIPLLFGLMVLSLVNRQLTSSRVLQTRPLVYLGAISYSVYMVHSLVYWFTTQTFRFIVPALGFEQWDQMNSILFTLISVGLTIAVAHVTYHRIEMRFFKPRTAVKPDAEPAPVPPVREASEASR